MVKALPNDLTRCQGVGCVKRPRCRRYLTLTLDHAADLERGLYLPRPFDTDLSDPAAGDCDYFIEDK